MANVILDGLRNLVSGLGYWKDQSTVEEFYHLETSKAQIDYAYRNWLVKKCIDIPVDDSFKKDRYITTSDQEKIDLFYEIETRFKVKDCFIQAAKLGRLYGGAGILIGTADLNWSQPLIDRSQLTHLVVLSRYDFTRVELNKEEYTKPNYRAPEFYHIKGTKIHYTRVIQFDGDLLPYDLYSANGYWHGSLVSRLNDAIKPAQNAIQNCSALINRFATDVFKTPDFMNKLASRGEESAMIERFQTAAYMRSNFNMMVLDKEEDYIVNSMSITGLPDTMMAFLRVVAGAADIPATRLIGDAASGLNATGEGDLRNYYDHIAADQNSIYLPRYAQIDPLLCRLVWGTVPEGFRSQFQALWEESDKERAEVEQLRAQTDSAYLTAGVLTPAIVARRLQENETYAFEADYIEALESYQDKEETTVTDRYIGRAPDSKKDWVVQSLIFSKEEFNESQAKEWIASHKDFGNYDIDTTETSYRFRQYDPGHFSTFRNQEISKGITAVFGKVKG